MNVEYVLSILYTLPYFYDKNTQVENIKYTKKGNMATIEVKSLEIEGKEQLDVG